ncbi:DUF1769-domain-containing protein [Ascodesmis nigricans]|uniref:DUF1769-domain-containing protein n=1 Tax=Ascodesmis nigricans TaxID=341454 RepID=A0A4S2MUE7_9PEZI|nr:DUF1769-domain-containing protein [Ascodesmis nigricans]
MHSLLVLSGPDTTTLKPHTPNTPDPIRISPTTLISLHLKTFTGQPPAPPTSPIFTIPPHQSDLFSLQLTFTPSHDINGDDLVLANTFDRPIRDSLPYFFPAAWAGLRIIDPGVDGDPYADRPFIYGPCLSSINYMRICSPDESSSSSSSSSPEIITEDFRLASDPDLEIPPENAKQRMKYFLDADRRRKFTFRKGVTYKMDFANGFIEFDGFTVTVPRLGWKVSVLRYWDGQPFRYELVDRRTKEGFGVEEEEEEEKEKEERKDQKGVEAGKWDTEEAKGVSDDVD